MQNTNKAAAYLGARKWLEWHADTHAEMSPMDGEAYLLAGRKAFYNAHHRKGHSGDPRGQRGRRLN